MKVEWNGIVRTKMKTRRIVSGNKERVGDPSRKFLGDDVLDVRL